MTGATRRPWRPAMVARPCSAAFRPACRRMALVAGLACLAACVAAPPPPEPVIHCREIPNDLVECVVIEPAAPAQDGASAVQSPPAAFGAVSNPPATSRSAVAGLNAAGMS